MPSKGQNRMRIGKIMVLEAKNPGKPQKRGLIYRLSEKIAIFGLCNCRIQKWHFFNFPAPPRGFFQKKGQKWPKNGLKMTLFGALFPM